ncbi:MAG: hypothetical protein WBW49_25065, partial [Candidatus Acidiferrum sp.]
MSATAIVAKQLELEDLTNEEVANHVIAGVQKLRALEPYLRELWSRFRRLKPGQTIMGCSTKTEFAEKHLNRSLRAVEYLLYGRSEQCSRPEYVTPPKHLQAVHDLRDWMERETPNAAKQVCVKPCGFGYGAGMGQGLKPGELEPSFDLELRDLTADEVKSVNKFIEETESVPDKPHMKHEPNPVFPLIRKLRPMLPFTGDGCENQVIVMLDDWVAGKSECSKDASE